MAFNYQPTLENEKVKIRPLVSTDFDALYICAGNPKVWEQHAKSDRYKKEVFQAFFDDGIQTQKAITVLNNEGKIIGSSRYRDLEDVPSAVEIGWTFLSIDYWGGQYNRAFKSLMLDHAFTHFDDVVFYVAGDNERSKKAVMKLGGVLLGKNERIELHKKAPNYSSFVIRKIDWLQANG